LGKTTADPSASPQDDSASGEIKREDNRQSRNILEGIPQGLKPTAFLEAFCGTTEVVP
jgi:hypothetical protein